MYKRKDLPSEGDLVVCTVTKIENSVVFVDLDEYENAKGIIRIDEVAAGRIRSIKDYVDVGKKIVCKVIKVDPGNRILDLSLRRVSEGLRRAKLDEFKKEKMIYNLLKNFSEKEKISWKKIENMIEKILRDYDLLYPFFQEVVVERKNLISKYLKDQKISEKLFKFILERISPPKIVRKGILTLYCLKKDGIKIIKSILNEISKIGFEVKYKGAPEYYIKIEAKDVKEINKKIKDLNKILEKEKKERGIYFEINWEK